VTALQLRIDSLPPTADRERLAADLGELRGMIDQIVREARRSEREGLVAESDGLAVLVERTRFWEPQAQDQGRPFSLTTAMTGPVPVRAVEEDLSALLDVLLDNVFTHAPDTAAIRVDVGPRLGGGPVLTVADDGPGFSAAAVERGSSAAGGRLTVSSGEAGGAVVVVELGAPL